MFELPHNFPAIPEINGISFYILHDPHERYVLEELKLIEKISIEDLLIQHLLPWTRTMPNMPNSCRRALSDW